MTSVQRKPNGSPKPTANKGSLTGPGALGEELDIELISFLVRRVGERRRR
jgi:hypothetical protein